MEEGYILQSEKKKMLTLAIAAAFMATSAPAWAAQMPQQTGEAAKEESSAAPVAAAEDDHALEDTVVTATRREKRDIDVPAATMVITGEAIKESGAADAADALAKVNGFAYKSFGPSGASMGTMNNELNVRGFKSGTLVLMNGSPISWRGKYNLDQIPADQIERIEVVKGSGSVLYGSEAMSGIVNIITKKGASNAAHVGFGNFGQRQYGVSAGDERFGVYYNYDKWGHLNGLAETDVISAKFNGSTRTDLRDVEKTSAGLTYHINPQLDFLFGYYKTEATYLRFVDRVDRTSSGVRLGDPFHARTYTTEQYVSQLNYHDHAWKGSLYFNTGTVEAKGPTEISRTGAKTPGDWYNTRERNTTYGVDLQRTWKLDPKATAVLGFSLEHELYKALPAPSTKNPASYMRNNWGVFGQWEQKFTERDTGIFGMRETWTTAAMRDENYHNFSASGQWLHKLDHENSLYLSVSQSFVMPKFAQMYGASSRLVPAPDLKPQTGVTYEIGWKAKHAGHTWKAALFHMDVKDNITATWKPRDNRYQYTNEDFRNTGLELSCETQGKHGFSWNWGVTWQNPETKGSKGTDWERTFGKLQLTGGVLYKRGKWSSSLTGSYLAGRVQSPSSEPSYACKPYFLTSWSTAYHPDERSEIRLSVENVLDRADVTSHTGANYRVAPTNFMLSCNYTF